MLKVALTSAPVLAMPEEEGKFIVDTHASNYAIGAVLSQLQGGQEKVAWPTPARSCTGQKRTTA